MKRVAILPFFNQSGDATVDGDFVAAQYYAALQAIDGFEVIPMGVTKNQWLQFSIQNGEPTSGSDFQALAKAMGVEAIAVGSITDYKAYYPPRMAMTVHWYAANEGYHPIPAGYGLPWGTDQEKQIPRRIVRQAEFELARSQLATQSPVADVAPAVAPNQAPQIDQLPPGNLDSMNPDDDSTQGAASQASHSDTVQIPEVIESAEHIDFYDSPYAEEMPIDGEYVYYDDAIPVNQAYAEDPFAEPLPPNWPDPTDLIPDPPSPIPPLIVPNHEPVLAHTRMYQGDDPYFTGRLADFVETGDDARSSGWQAYLRRSDDFVRFCCHLHIIEMLESRGGKEQSEFILRWPLSRY